MFENEEEGGVERIYLLGCPVALALVLVMLLLVFTVGGSILGFAFNSNGGDEELNAVEAIVTEVIDEAEVDEESTGGESATAEVELEITVTDAPEANTQATATP